LTRANVFLAFDINQGYSLFAPFVRLLCTKARGMVSSEFSIICGLNCDFYDPYNCQVGIHYHKKAVEADDSVKICQSSLRSGNLKTWHFGFAG